MNTIREVIKALEQVADAEGGDHPCAVSVEVNGRNQLTEMTLVISINRLSARWSPGEVPKFVKDPPNESEGKQ